MKNKHLLFLLIFILSSTTIIAENPLNIEIIAGNNKVFINESFPSIYASELIREYPQIESISISEYGNSYGYINKFGGIGKNILIEPNKEYEIFSNESFSISLKG